MATRRGKGVADAAGVRLNVHISEEAHRRLGLHALMTGKKPGKLLEELIGTHMRAWKVQVNSPAGIDRSVAGELVSPATAAVPN